MAKEKINFHSENETDLYVYFKSKYDQNYFKINSIKSAVEKCFIINKELKQFNSSYKASVKTEGKEIKIIFKK